MKSSIFTLLVTLFGMCAQGADSQGLATLEAPEFARNLGVRSFLIRPDFMVELGNQDSVKEVHTSSEIAWKDFFATVVAVKPFVKYSARGLLFKYLKNGEDKYYYGGGGASGHLQANETPDFSDMEGKTLEEQLIAAGFEKLQEGMFAIELNNRNFLTPISDGRIVGMFSPARAQAFLFNSDAEVKGIISHSLRATDRPEKHLVLENPFMRGLLSSQGSIISVEVKVDGSQVPVDFRLSSIKQQPANDTFKRGGVNETASITEQSKVNGSALGYIGYALSQIGGSCSSSSGHSHYGESLVTKMQKANEVVLTDLKLTHQKIGHPLVLADALSSLGVWKFTYNSRVYLVQSIGYLCGTYSSPFGDGQSTSKGSRLIVTDEETGEKLQMSGLGALYVYLYGYYEDGITPKKVAEFFGVK